jgi:adenosylcobinamide-GDP ribazoletransferase
VLVLLTKYAALASSSGLWPALVISTTLSRWGMALAIFIFPYAREHGLGRDVKDNVRWPQVILATCITLIVVWLAGTQMGLVAFALAGLTLWLSARYILRLIPGLTGDSYGALCEGIELVILLLFSARVVL